MYDRPLKKYTVCLIFNEDGTKVLLQLKNRTLYNGKLNGVGGKIEADETPLDGAYREIKEETSLTPDDIPNLRWIATLIPCEQCDDRYSDMYPELFFFAGSTKNVDKAQKPNSESEAIGWYNIKNDVIDEPESKLAGDGNLGYIIKLAIRVLKLKGQRTI